MIEVWMEAGAGACSVIAAAAGGSIAARGPGVEAAARACRLLKRSRRTQGRDMSSVHGRMRTKRLIAQMLPSLLRAHSQLRGGTIAQPLHGPAAAHHHFFDRARKWRPA
jgi:hypothetical protein